MVITYFRKKEDDEDSNKNNKEVSRHTSKFFGLIPAIVSVVLFILTEDMRNRIRLTDRWTLIMIVIMLINFLLAFLTRNRYEEYEEEEQA